MDVQGKRVLVVGLGKSGIAAARFLHERGARVIANDLRDLQALDDVARDLQSLGIELALGSHDSALFTSADCIVVSPGVPRLDALDEAERKGVPILSEIELASRFVEATIVGITGTNGKSTVTSLIGEILAQTDRPHFVGGNLGTPFVDAIGETGSGSGGCLVVELSSFQLERVDRFRAHVAVLLNVTDDHLDRYDSFAEYAAAKAHIFDGQQPDDHALVPAGDAICGRLASKSKAMLHTFGGQDGEVRVRERAIVDSVSGLEIPLDELKLTGAHNYENVCAAALAARLAQLPRQAIEAGIRSFRGLAHRMAFVRELDGVRYYDDSKATNVGASVAAIDGLDEGVRVVLIAGGRDKGGSYAPLRERMAARGRAVVLIGEAAETIASSFEGAGFPVVLASDLEAAVEKCRELARPGDAVLLAPACASFDMFRSYAARGEVFEKAVLALVEVP